MFRRHFGRLRGVRNTRSTIVLSTVKESQALPLAIHEAEEEAHGA